MLGSCGRCSGGGGGQAAAAKGSLSMLWRAEIFVFCSFRTRPVLTCGGLGFTAPHEVAGPATQWEAIDAVETR